MDALRETINALLHLIRCFCVGKSVTGSVHSFALFNGEKFFATQRAARLLADQASFRDTLLKQTCLRLVTIFRIAFVATCGPFSVAFVVHLYICLVFCCCSTIVDIPKLL
jgi:hypothetical protein